MFLSVFLTCLAIVWLSVHLVVRRKMKALAADLPDAYQAAAFAAPDDPAAPHLIPLAIDLMRKERCTPAFDTLSPAERQAALNAYAVEKLPHWMTKYVTMTLHGSDKALLGQLRHIKASQPKHPEIHFGAIKAQQRLRSAPET